MIEEKVAQSCESRVVFPVSPHTSCATLHKSLNLSMTQIFICEMEITTLIDICSEIANLNFY